MATISKAALSRYRGRLDALGTRASRQTQQALLRWLRANPNATVAEIREAAIRLATAAVDRYGNGASTLACDLFDAVMELEGIETADAVAYAETRTGVIDGSVRRIVGGVDGTEDGLDRFLRQLAAVVEREVRYAANDTVMRNTETAMRANRGKRIRFARVPSSGVPCKWCAMLASRGFVYWQATTAAAASHRDCKCVILPGIKDRTKVSGYDPEHYMDVWLNHEKYEHDGGE